jgi:hypothetical protein
MAGLRLKLFMKNNKKTKSRKKRLTLEDKALIALQEAVKAVYKRAKEHRYPLATWKNGKVVIIKPWIKKRKKQAAI